MMVRLKFLSVFTVMGRAVGGGGVERMLISWSWCLDLSFGFHCVHWPLWFMYICDVAGSI